MCGLSTAVEPNAAIFTVKRVVIENSEANEGQENKNLIQTSSKTKCLLHWALNTALHELCTKRMIDVV